MRLLIFLLVTSFTYSQNIWRVDNNSENVADFTSLTNALADVSVVNGDIIYIAGSVVSYGSTTITKSVKVYGPGYFLGQNPNTQASLLEARLVDIIFNNGSQGSELHGLRFDEVNINTDNILVTNCYATKSSDGIQITGAVSNSIQNVIISQNYLAGYIHIDSYVTNVVITNNIFDYIYQPGVANSSSYVEHNVYQVWNNFSTLTNSIFQNNIINAVGDQSSLESNNNTAKNNITLGTGLSTVTGDDNVISASSADIFVVSGSSDGKFVLKAGSIALGAGVAGVDIGIFGGASPYVLSGIPSIPSIYDVSIPVFGTSDGLNVNIKAKSNN